MSAQTVSSVQKAARVLCAFTRKEREFGVRELARRLGLGKSATHRLPATLAAEHLIERDRTTGRYRLGIKIYELGTLVPAHQGCTRWPRSASTSCTGGRGRRCRSGCWTAPRSSTSSGARGSGR